MIVGTIAEVVANVNKLDLTKEAMRSVVTHKEDIADLNRDQLLDGLTFEGKKIAPEYRSPSYARQKNRRNPMPGYGIPDLYKTGRFHEGIKVDVVDKDKFDQNSTDSKNSMLKGKYPNIMGISEDSKSELIGPKGFEDTLLTNVKEVTKL